MTTDTAGRITFLNPVASALSSWKPQEALGRPVQKVFQIINEETREPAEDVVGQVLGEGCVVTQTDHTALVTRDGSKIPIEGSAAPITDSSGNLLGAVLVFHDVMERRRTQDALRKSEERYRNLFVTMAEGFALHELICDAEGRPADYRFLEVNPAFERLTGLQSIEVLGHTIREVIPGIESIWIERYGKVALTGEPDQFEAWSDVLGRWYEVRVSQSEPGRFAVVFLDITHRRQAEEALLESQRDLNRAQAVAHIGSWRLDVRRNELFWSDETHRIFGIARGTPLSYETFLAAIHPEDREVVDGRWQAALRGDRYDLEHRIVVGDRIKWVRQRAELEFDNEGGLLGAFGTVQDITGRKGMEIELRRARDELELRVRERTDELAQALGDSKTYAARLELLNQELQEFAFVASHDLAEPLRKIQTFGERLRTKCEMSLGEEGCDYLLRMESAANRMQVLLASLLAYSRVTTQANPLRETDLGRVAQEVLSDLEIPIEISGGHVEIGSLPLVRADSAQMYQLLQNLIHNALKYSSKDEPLVRVYGHAANNVAEIFVEDNGIGFDEKYLDRIFKPFQRLHGRNSEYEGTGMGLAICRKIVERHGGTITAKSVPGKGSTFIVTLPVKQRSGKADQPQLSRA
jgi:PAS domain S-box-containing protein